MWVPKDEAEIEAALTNGILVERSTFDAKVALPAVGKNKDLAKDVCAMTGDGGVLLYGVGGSDPTRPDELVPIELAGVAERIDQVAQAGIAEPPVLDVRLIPCAQDVARGYVCVVIPPSPRAPHMLTIDRDNRFWGRGATGNRILTEGEIARLYERRERWDTDRDRLLDDTIARLPFTFPIREEGAIAVLANPVATGQELLRAAAGAKPVSEFLAQNVVAVAAKYDIYPGQGTSGLGQTGLVSRAGADWWILSRERDISSRYQARLEIGPGGGATYWHSPVMNKAQNGLHYVLEQSVTRAVYQLIATATWIYERAAFHGSVDVGVGVLGIERARGATLLHSFDPDSTVYGANDYRRHERVTSHELRTDLAAVTRRLLAPLYEAISKRGYDPLADSTL